MEGPTFARHDVPDNALQTVPATPYWRQQLSDLDCWSAHLASSPAVQMQGTGRTRKALFHRLGICLQLQTFEKHQGADNGKLARKGFLSWQRTRARGMLAAKQHSQSPSKFSRLNRAKARQPLCQSSGRQEEGRCFAVERTVTLLAAVAVGCSKVNCIAPPIRIWCRRGGIAPASTGGMATIGLPRRCRRIPGSRVAPAAREPRRSPGPKGL